MQATHPTPGMSRRESGGKILCKGGGRGDVLNENGGNVFYIYREMEGLNHFPCWDLCRVLMVSGEGCESCSAGMGSTTRMPQASLATSCFLHLGHPWPVTQRPSGMHV